MEDLRLHDAVVFLAAAGLVIPLVKRLRISPVLGFLLIGLTVGPFGLGRFAQDHDWLEYILITDVAGVRALAELGVIFLLFMIGLELSFERLWSMRRLVFGMGSAQILVTALVIGAIAWMFGNDVQASILLGACLALSSTAVVMQLLIEQGRFGSDVGRGSFAILLAQDIAVVPILFAVGVFGADADGSPILDLSLALAAALLAVFIILSVGRLVVRPLFRFVGASDSPELFMALTLLTVIATAAATHAVGLSAALGAFLAGLLLAESEYRHEIEINIEPFKGLLLGLFFMSVAMGIDPVEIVNKPLLIGLSVVGLFGIKMAVTAVLSRLFGFRWSQASEIGLLLGQGGEFAFIVVGLALGFDLLVPSTAQFMLIVVGASLFLTPSAARFARRLGTMIQTREQSRTNTLEDAPVDLAGHVILVGYGRTGQLLAKLLDRQRIAHVILDLDTERVASFRRQGVPIHRGDASREAMLRKLRLRHAAAVAICIDDSFATREVLLTVRRLAPTVPIIARARDNEHALSLIALGATRVVPEVLEAGLQLGHLLLEEVGLPVNVARDLIEAVRVESEQALSSQAGFL